MIATVLVIQLRSSFVANTSMMSMGFTRNVNRENPLTSRHPWNVTPEAIHDQIHARIFSDAGRGFRYSESLI